VAIPFYTRCLNPSLNSYPLNPKLYVVLVDSDKLRIVFNFLGEKEIMNYFTKLSFIDGMEK